jgi:hypothetical protein
VRVVDTATGRVTLREHVDFQHAIDRSGKPGSFQFTLPTSAPAGAGKLYVVTNGIASAAQSITVN